MEEATGGDLLTAIQEQKRIPEKQSAIWFRQMCDAIDYCHQRGVVHRDLKCENLLLDHRVTPIIMSPVHGGIRPNRCCDCLSVIKCTFIKLQRHACLCSLMKVHFMAVVTIEDYRSL